MQPKVPPGKWFTDSGSLADLISFPAKFPCEKFQTYRKVEFFCKHSHAHHLGSIIDSLPLSTIPLPHSSILPLTKGAVSG